MMTICPHCKQLGQVPDLGDERVCLICARRVSPTQPTPRSPGVSRRLHVPRWIHLPRSRCRARYRLYAR